MTHSAENWTNKLDTGNGSIAIEFVAGKFLFFCFLVFGFWFLGFGLVAFVFFSFFFFREAKKKKKQNKNNKQKRVVCEMSLQNNFAHSKNDIQQAKIKC